MTSFGLAADVEIAGGMASDVILALPASSV